MTSLRKTNLTLTHQQCALDGQDPSQDQVWNDATLRSMELEAGTLDPQSIEKAASAYGQDVDLFIEDFMKVLDPEQCVASSDGRRAIREWLHAIWQNSTQQEFAVFAVGLSLAAVNAALGLRGPGTLQDKSARSLLAAASVAGGVMGVYHNLISNEALGGKGYVSGLHPLASGLNAFKQLELTTAASLIPIAMVLAAHQSWSRTTAEDVGVMIAQNAAAFAAGGARKTPFANEVVKNLLLACADLGKDFDFSGHAMMQTTASSAYVRAFQYLKDNGFSNVDVGCAYGLTPVMALANAIFMYNTALNYHSPVEMAAGAGVGAAINLTWNHGGAVVQGVKKTSSAIGVSALWGMTTGVPNLALAVAK